MNNNRNNTNNNNNRRRGRGSNRPQGGGGRGEQLNRIDSRARGNAPQLLEKFKKLASDAHLNGDRVTAEYYLQFADHYFRVIADARLRQEEQRVRRDERPGEGSGYSAQDDGDEGEFSGNDDFGGFDSPAYRRDEPRNEPRSEPRNEPREPREFRNEQRPPRDDRGDDGRDRAAQDEPDRDADPAEDAAPAFEPEGANPFTRDNPRDNRGTRGLRPRREPRAPRVDDDAADRDAGGGGIDPSLLPPAIAESRDAVASDDEAPAPRRRGRPRRAASDDGGEPLEAVSG